MKKLLTYVVAGLVTKKEISGEYGVSIINLPDFNYKDFVGYLNFDKKIEIFFLGFEEKKVEEIKNTISCNDKLALKFTVEEAEESRNSGDESIFRILIVKSSEIEKLSSLRWFPEISLNEAYIGCCDYSIHRIGDINTTVNSLIHALKRKNIRNILSFERVLDYLETLINSDSLELPNVIVNDIYKLGLCSNKNVVIGNPGIEELIKRIKHNHDIVEKIGNLEQSERQSITNYYSDKNNSKDIPRLILKFYKSKNADLLQSMELEDVENCLKAVKKTSKTSKTKGGSVVDSTSLGAQLVFDDNKEQIDKILGILNTDIDGRDSTNKKDRINIDVDGTKIQIKVSPITEKIVDEFIDDEDFGGVIYSDVSSPTEAIKDIDKYDYIPITKTDVDSIMNELKTIAGLLKDENISILQKLESFLESRNKLLIFKKRLQDTPMLQVLAEKDLFFKYLLDYESLLLSVNEDFPKIWALASSNAKKIVSMIMSLDNIFIVGNKECHAVPTPLNPLYLWKYIKLAEEILASKGIDSLDEHNLSEDDKNFIVRKAEDIPDPLTVMLLPQTIRKERSIFLTIAGRIGLLPIYSTKSQIDQSENGVDALEQAIIRYMCLYPHAGMMLRVSVIDPPSVEMVVDTLKKLNNQREFNTSGMDVSIFRTKECDLEWSEIDDESLNEGYLGKHKGKKDLNFRFKVINKKLNYDRVLSQISEEQHIVIIFDPNEVKVETVTNNKNIHIHPLCVPKVYHYNPIDEKVEIRPANEGDVFTIYSSILEKLNESPSAFTHTSSFFNTPLKKETYDSLLGKTDWLIILDQSLKTWDISLKSVSNKLFYKENDYRSMGIYSKNASKFILGYNTLIKQLGNYVPNDAGINNIIESIREINDDGLLSIVSHTSNRIFDVNHGKGSLGLAISAVHYKNLTNNPILVGLDTQLAREWLSDRDDGKLPDLIGIKFIDDLEAIVDVIEVKTHSNDSGSFVIDNSEKTISGHAVEQVTTLETLIREMFGLSEKITTVSRKEILREQVFESLFESDKASSEKHDLSEQLNKLFAGELLVSVNKIIYSVDFEKPESVTNEYRGKDEYECNKYYLTQIGSNEIQNILINNISEMPIEHVNEYEDRNDTISSNNYVIKENSSEIIENEYDSFLKKMDEFYSSSVSIPQKEKIEGIDNNSSYDENPELNEQCEKLYSILKQYDIKTSPVTEFKARKAARFTRFEIALQKGESINKIQKNKDNICIQMEAFGDILIEHIRGTNLISIDIPLSQKTKPINLIEHLPLLNQSNGNLDILAGQKADGQVEIMDLAKAPHMLIAGTTGSGKTIFLYSIIVSLLYRNKLDDIEFLIIDPKQTDFTFFKRLPNLYGGKVITDVTEALEMINRINEVDKNERTNRLTQAECRDIISYNASHPNDKMKRLVVLIDEYADLVTEADNQGSKKDFERMLLQLAQRVRNLGINLIIATQRPTSNIVTGNLKANLPYRVSFRLPQHTDSQVILDKPGAENLLGKGDMLVVTDEDTMRLQGLFITEDELKQFIGNLIK